MRLNLDVNVTILDTRLGFAQRNLFAKCISLSSCKDLDLKKEKENHYFSFLQHSWLGEEERRNFISEDKKQSRKKLSCRREEHEYCHD